MALDSRPEKSSQSKPSGQRRDTTRFLYERKPEGVPDRRTPQKSRLSAGKAAMLFLGGASLADARPIPDSPSSALSTWKPEPTSHQWNGTPTLPPDTPSRTSELSPSLSHRLEAYGIGHLLRKEDTPSAPTSDQHDRQKGESTNTVDTRSGSQELRKTGKTRRDLPPAELCQEALANKKLVEAVLENPKFIGDVLNHTELVQQMLENPKFIEDVLGNRTFVETVFQKKELIDKVLNDPKFVDNALKNEFWANLGINTATRYGIPATEALVVLAVSYVSVAVVRHLRRRGRPAAPIALAAVGGAAGGAAGAP